MNKKNTKLFIMIIVMFMVVNILSPDRLVSGSERRQLNQFPAISLESILNGTFADEFEEYALDQFFWRDGFRGIKSYMELYGFHKKDINGIYMYDGHLIKRIEAYHEKNIDYFVDYIKKIQGSFDESSQMYYMVIPDKKYFVMNESFQTIDYDDLLHRLEIGLDDVKPIDIMDLLTLDDYYLTDIHWRQEALDNVLNQMAKDMAFTVDLSDIGYEKHSFEGFKGVYIQQSALMPSGETLYYLESDVMKDIIVYNYEKNIETNGVYNEELLTGMDSYDVFLGGASPLISLENPHAETDKELIIFRDSFSSSLTPLLIEQYAKITLVDTRYMSFDYLDQFIELGNQDVLFAYNVEVINNSQMLR